MEERVVVFGGCGRAGLPLGIALADVGCRTTLYDINTDAVDLVNRGSIPFLEEGAVPVLERVVADGVLDASSDPSVVADAGVVVVILGTPIDDHLNPDPGLIPRVLEKSLEYFRDGQVIILRSTVYPGVTALVERMFSDAGLDVDVVFCPERIAEGRALTELRSLPQLIGAREGRGRERAERFFKMLTDKVVHLSPEEAEVAKLFTNAWRYIKFATANQFYMVANDFGLDFDKIRRAVVDDYPRAADIPGAGFAAGPCLFKDTMQLAAFNNNQFTLGHAAMLVNEGLPLYVAAKVDDRIGLSGRKVGLLGMAFKGGSDDVRSSLAYKLKKILEFKGATVLCTDPYVKVDPDLVSLEKVLAEAEIVIISAPHSEYATIDFGQEVVDIWNVTGRGSRS